MPARAAALVASIVLTTSSHAQAVKAGDYLRISTATGVVHGRLVTVDSAHIELRDRGATRTLARGTDSDVPALTSGSS